MKKRIGYILVYTCLTLFAVFTLIPFAYMGFSAFKATESFFTFPFWPTDGAWYRVDWSAFTFAHFEKLFVVAGISRATVNSFFFASVTALAATLCSAMAGYALSKYEFFGRRTMIVLVLILLITPGVLLLAPMYKLMYWLGLLDSYGALILPAIAPAFGVFLFRATFRSALPDEMLAAARIDGCGEVRLFFTIALPMAKPMIGAFLLITYLGAWNNFIGPQIFLQSPEQYPLAVAVAQLRGPYSTEWGLIMAGTLVGVLPVLALFLLLQRDFIMGLTIGSVKG